MVEPKRTTSACDIATLHGNISSQTEPNFNVGSVYFDYNGGFIGFAEYLTARFTQASALYRDGTTNRYIGIVDYVYVPPVPEPATCLMAAIGMVCAAVRRV